MKKLNEKQTKINYHLTKLMIENDNDKETQLAVQSAQCAFINHINTGEIVELKVTPTGL